MVLGLLRIGRFAVQWLASAIVLKVPFLAPWFRGKGPVGQLLKNAVQSPEITGLLDGAQVERLHAEHLAGGADHSELLWGVLNLALWRQAYRL